ILDLQKDGHAIYPHTHSHKRLNEINDEATAEMELVRPKKILEDLLQSPMDAFAYPVGTERVIGAFAFSYLKKNYQYCFTALAGKNTFHTDPFFLHRDCMNANYDVDHLKRIQQGVLDQYYQYKLRKFKNKAVPHGVSH
ncbi:MAG: polysaccharide deacetylase family protein, partial [Candidatus Omnitrophica bacterium]|nr:polysaccharide deacetylase family protein [Candidatus Omnitrophota bacterium]